MKNLKLLIGILLSTLFLVGCVEPPPETEKVATPTATPAAGAIDSAMSVSLSCATEAAAIYYTINGDIPTISSSLYSTPIIINAALTIKAIAVKNGMDNSDILTASYTVKEDTTTEPDTAINSENDIIETAAGINFTLKLVQGGSFIMGCTQEQEGNCKTNELPLRTVSLSDFYLGETEVTQELWLAVMGKWPDRAPNEADGAGDKYPARFVSWNDIVGIDTANIAYTINGINYCEDGFCYKLSQAAASAGGSRQFRLPTEAEWEYAARGGSAAESQTLYSGSDNIDDVAWYSGNTDKAHEVGSKAANALGIYDMSGNAWEWCSDRYGTYSSEDESNPTGVETGNSRVFRGGSYFYPAERHRVAYRLSFMSGGRIHDVGFRVGFSKE